MHRSVDHKYKSRGGKSEFLLKYVRPKIFRSFSDFSDPSKGAHFHKIWIGLPGIVGENAWMDWKVLFFVNSVHICGDLFPVAGFISFWILQHEMLMEWNRWFPTNILDQILE